MNHSGLYMIETPRIHWGNKLVSCYQNGLKENKLTTKTGYHL